MKKVKVEEIEFEIIKNERDGFNEQEFIDRYTSYFNDFDYVVGDYAYGKLRLKGFYQDNNEKVSEINNIKNVDKYIKENCAFGCKYYIAKKIILWYNFFIVNEV